VLPSGVRIYAVGDIHGRLDLLDELLARIEADAGSRPPAEPIFVFLGDYIDRGPSSRETVDRLMAHGETSRSVFLKGNHESVLLECLADSRFFNAWIRLGGLQTMRSYDVAPDVMRGDVAKLQESLRSALPESHLRFFRDLQSSFTCGDFFFVHAGVKPAVGLAQQKEKDLLWIREEFLSCNDDFGKVIVHGHTPRDQVEVKANRINIDTGAFTTNRLTCLVIQDGFVSTIDTV
jgi:serine/threonine protein phosphatase 1